MPRVLYIDEAGIGNPKDEPFLVVAGVLVHFDDQLNKVYKALGEIGRMMPEKCQEERVILHPSALYGGNGRFDENRHPEWKGKRWPILEALAEVPNTANARVMWSSIERATFPYGGIDFPDPLPGMKKTKPIKKPSATVAAHALAYMACLLEADVWLRENRKKENCLVIAENNEEARAALKFIHSYHQAKDMPLTEDVKSHFPLRRIREDPGFQEKRADHPLILADFVAFIIKRVLMKDANAVSLFEPWRARLVSLNKEDALLPD